MRKVLLISVGLVVVLAGFLLAIVLSSLGQPTIREAVFPNNVRFIARLMNADAAYFSVRVGDRHTTLSDDILFRFQVRGRTYHLSSLSPADVQQMGGEVSTPDYVDEPERTRHGFLGWGEQNRDGGLEFDFFDGKLTEFYARWHLSGPSPFSLISDSDEQVTFPFDDDKLRQAFGEPTGLEDKIVK